MFISLSPAVGRGKVMFHLGLAFFIETLFLNNMILSLWLWGLDLPKRLKILDSIMKYKVLQNVQMLN